jgi:hypothetical protein
LTVDDGVIGYRRAGPGGDVVVLVNYTDDSVRVGQEGLEMVAAVVDDGRATDTGSSVAPRWTVALSSDGTGEGLDFAGSLRPDQAVVLTPPGAMKWATARTRASSRWRPRRPATWRGRRRGRFA